MNRDAKTGRVLFIFNTITKLTFTIKISITEMISMDICSKKKKWLRQYIEKKNKHYIVRWLHNLYKALKTGEHIFIRGLKVLESVNASVNKPNYQTS